jgi:hypothetical protein
MSAPWFLLFPLGLVLFIAALAVAALFSPVVVTVDSGNGQVRVRWLTMLEFLSPLPGTAGEARLSVAGRPFRVPLRKKGSKIAAGRTEVSAPRRAPVRKTTRTRRPLGRFFWRCLSDPAIRRALARQLARLWRQLLRSAALTGWRTSVSLPDPAMNGMLAGALAQYGWGRRLGILVNFSGQNSAVLELRLRPHRVAKAFLFFLSGLPYRAMVREWRASSARRRQESE